MNKNKFMVLLILFVIVICISVSYYSYAMYFTKNNGEADGKIARWYITLNGEDINSKRENAIEIIQEKNPNIADGVIAPTSLAYFDLDIDATATDVDLEYTIEVSSPENSVIRDFSIYKMVDKIDNSEIYADSAKITGTMSLKNADGTQNTDKTISKKIYIEWSDDDNKENHMTDEEDTKAAAWITRENDDGTTTKVKNMGIVNVSITFRQIPKQN